jgi:hypothetical protein
MTCNRIIALLVLAGTSFLGLAGCESQPYKSWQPGESWGNKENQAHQEAKDTEAAEQAAGTVETQASQPVIKAEAATLMDSEANTTSGTTGDVLLIDSIESAPAIQTPRNGVNMASVRQQYGNPVSEGAAIGDPPITRWEYEGFSVYFEYDLVLHSVIHRPNQN